MQTVYKDLNIKTNMNHTTFHILNIVFEEFFHPIPSHSHGNNSYELHYIPHGFGKAVIEGQNYEIKPNTLFMTGPHIEHEQIPESSNPMQEYCLYFKLRDSSAKDFTDPDSIEEIFKRTHFWFGADSQNIHPIMQQIFFELEHKYAGYMYQVESLIIQCIIKVVRNYKNLQLSKQHFPPSNLFDRKYLIAEEAFLYEYNTITLQELARRLGLSSRQTERFIRQYYGKSFQEKKNDAKMSMARIFLSNGKLSVSEVALRLNYASIQHFSYGFRKYYGITPTQYRKNQANS